jgi:hypothetical protein
MTDGVKDKRCFPRWVWWGVFLFGMHAVDLQRAGNRENDKATLNYNARLGKEVHFIVDSI